MAVVIIDIEYGYWYMENAGPGNQILDIKVARKIGENARCILFVNRN